MEYVGHDKQFLEIHPEPKIKDSSPLHVLDIQLKSGAFSDFVPLFDSLFSTEMTFILGCEPTKIRIIPSKPSGAHVRFYSETKWDEKLVELVFQRLSGTILGYLFTKSYEAGTRMLTYRFRKTPVYNLTTTIAVDPGCSTPTTRSTVCNKIKSFERITSSLQHNNALVGANFHHYLTAGGSKIMSRFTADSVEKAAKILLALVRILIFDNKADIAESIQAIYFEKSIDSEKFCFWFWFTSNITPEGGLDDALSKISLALAHMGPDFWKTLGLSLGSNLLVASKKKPAICSAYIIKEHNTAYLGRNFAKLVENNTVTVFPDSDCPHTLCLFPSAAVFKAGYNGHYKMLAELALYVKDIVPLSESLGANEFLLIQWAGGPDHVIVRRCKCDVTGIESLALPKPKPIDSVEELLVSLPWLTNYVLSYDKFKTSMNLTVEFLCRDAAIVAAAFLQHLYSLDRKGLRWLRVLQNSNGLILILSLGDEILGAMKAYLSQITLQVIYAADSSVRIVNRPVFEYSLQGKQSATLVSVEKLFGEKAKCQAKRPGIVPYSICRKDLPIDQTIFDLKWTLPIAKYNVHARDLISTIVLGNFEGVSPCLVSLEFSPGQKFFTVKGRFLNSLTPFTPLQVKTQIEKVIRGELPEKTKKAKPKKAVKGLSQSVISSKKVITAKDLDSVKEIEIFDMNSRQEAYSELLVASLETYLKQQDQLDPFDSLLEHALTYSPPLEITILVLKGSEEPVQIKLFDEYSTLVSNVLLDLLNEHIEKCTFTFDGRSSNTTVELRHLVNADEPVAVKTAFELMVLLFQLFIILMNLVLFYAKI